MFEVAEAAELAERKDATCTVKWRIRNSLASRQTPVKMNAENSGGHVMAELTFTARFGKTVIGDAGNSTILEAIVRIHVGRAAAISHNADWCVLSVTEKLI